MDRIAVLRFENLTADPSLDWISPAAPSILVAELTGGRRTVPIVNETVRDAYIGNATRLVHGYFDVRAGKLHFEIEVEDPSRHKMTLIDSISGEPLDVMNAIANKIQPGARAFSTSNHEALSAWGHGDQERAVALDPDFGEAWLAWAQKLAAAGDSTRALDIAMRALMRPTLRSPIERAQIELFSATLRHDDSTQAAALHTLARLAPADPSPRFRIAEMEMQSRHFQEAARAYRELADSGESGAALKNRIGYAEALAGDLDAARRAFEDYGREPGQAINAVDSMGEAYFMNGKFSDAERSFLDAYAKDPSFLNGATLWKAAHAHWLNGDLRGADGLIERYNPQDPLAAWRRANWLYETGRREQAVLLLKQAPPAIAPLAQRQIAVWSNPSAVPQDVAALQQLYQRADPLTDGLARTFYAAALFRAGRKDDARMLVMRWPVPDAGDNLLQALIYPQFLELRKALL